MDSTLTNLAEHLGVDEDELVKLIHQVNALGVRTLRGIEVAVKVNEPWGVEIEDVKRIASYIYYTPKS